MNILWVSVYIYVISAPFVQCYFQKCDNYKTKVGVDFKWTSILNQMKRPLFSRSLHWIWNLANFMQLVNQHKLQTSNKCPRESGTNQRQPEPFPQHHQQQLQYQHHDWRELTYARNTDTTWSPLKRNSWVHHHFCLSRYKKCHGGLFFPSLLKNPTCGCFLEVQFHCDELFFLWSIKF